MGIRENLPVGLGIVGGVAAAGATWFLNSALFGVVTGVLLGTGLSLWVQSRTQNRIWKRDLALKNIDSIYGPLYREITANQSKGSPSAKTSFQALSTAEWERIRSDYLYHSVPDPLKALLARHYALIEKYNTLTGRVVNKVGKTIVEKASSFYGSPLKSIQWETTLQRGYT